MPYYSGLNLNTCQEGIRIELYTRSLGYRAVMVL